MRRVWTFFAAASDQKNSDGQYWKNILLHTWTLSINSGSRKAGAAGTAFTTLYPQGIVKATDTTVPLRLELCREPSK